MCVTFTFSEDLSCRLRKGCRLAVFYPVNFYTLKFPPLTISFFTVHNGRDSVKPFKQTHVQEIFLQVLRRLKEVLVHEVSMDLLKT